MIPGRDEAEEGRKALDFLCRHGFRRCDIAACNCGSWHGGDAADRLREISDALDEAGVAREGGIIVKRIAVLVAKEEAAFNGGYVQGYRNGYLDCEEGDARCEEVCDAFGLWCAEVRDVR